MVIGLPVLKLYPPKSLLFPGQKNEMKITGQGGGLGLWAMTLKIS